MFDLRKEMREFDQMLSEMDGDEVMERLIENGYSRTKPPSDFGYVLSDNSYSVKVSDNSGLENSKLAKYTNMYLGAA